MEFERRCESAGYFPLPLLLHPTGTVRTLKTLKCRRMVYIWPPSASIRIRRRLPTLYPSNDQQLLCFALNIFSCLTGLYSHSRTTQKRLSSPFPRVCHVYLLIDMAWISATAPRFHRDIQCHVHFQLKGERTRDLIRTSNTRNLVGTWHISYAGIMWWNAVSFWEAGSCTKTGNIAINQLYMKAGIYFSCLSFICPYRM